MAHLSRHDLKTMVPQPRLYKRPPYTVEAAGAVPVEGETTPRRHPKCKDKLADVPEPDVHTLYDVVRRSSQQFGNAKALGMRKLKQVHKESKQIKKKVDGQEVTETKEWQYYELGPYEYISFVQYEQMTLEVGCGLRALGMHKDQKLHLFAQTSRQWLTMAHGAATQSMPIVTAYDTLGEEGLKHSLLETHANAIFLDPHLLTKLINPLKEGKEIKHVIYNDHFDVNQDDIKKLKDAHSHLTVHSFTELLELGKNNKVEPVPPAADDLCCVMYTSGSTGAPKGVLLKHRNVIAAIAGVNVCYSDYLGPGDGLLTYLPLAHIFEYVFENYCLYIGGTMGYGNPKTLTNSSVKNCLGDIAEFKPTILVGVPAVWETVKKGILAQVGKNNFIAQNMFWGGMNAKDLMMKTGMPGSGIGMSLLDSVIFKKIKVATGGRLRICLNGGGPVAKETQRFIAMAIAPLIIGYGLTETAAMGTLMDPLSWTDESMGQLSGAVEVKLVDYAEAGYHAANKPPQGEIWIRGGCITAGYLNREKETKESFTSDGWFKTGDIGEWDRHGALKIIDRKKNLVKTLNGEYIALEKLESVYRACSAVDNICVYAAADKAKPIAIVIPKLDYLKTLASQHGISHDSLEEFCADSKFNGIVLREMQSTGKKAGLQGIEILQGVVLTADEWTPANNRVTSAQKLNRKKLLDDYKTEINKAYS